MGASGALRAPRGLRASRVATTLPPLTERARWHIAVMARSGLFATTAIAEAFGVTPSTVLACRRSAGRVPGAQRSGPPTSSSAARARW